MATNDDEDGDDDDDGEDGDDAVDGLGCIASTKG